MASAVKTERSYTSPLRQEQAAATRRAINAAARRLFEKNGYVATSMPAVASQAGVAVKTVYLAYRTKAELLRGVWDDRLAGDEAAIPVLERSWYQQVELGESPAEKLRLLARQSGGVKARTGRLLMVIRDAASTDQDVAALWAHIEAKLLEVSSALVSQIANAGALNPSLDPPAAADLLWTLNHPSTWQLLVLQRGWTDDEYQTWLERSLAASLLA